MTVAGLITVVAGGVVALDQLAKFAVRRSMEVGAEVPLLPFFSLYHIENTGTAFGLFQDRNGLFIGVSLAVLGLMAWLAREFPAGDRRSWWGQGLIWGGAIGNLIDRAWRGRVTDYLDLFCGPHHWPSFNVADSAITIGAGLLLWCAWKPMSSA